jgi:hypothetical protein
VGSCLLGFAAILAESYLRFVSISTDAYGASLTTKRWQKAYAPVNSVYCRDAEWPETKPPGTYRIAFLGDSFTYGWGINNEEDRFTEILQEHFDADSGRRVEIMNVAWAGWNTEDHLRALRELLEPYQVDEVVLCYLPNDIQGLIPVQAENDPRQPPSAVYVNVESSFLLDYLFHRVVAPRMQSGPPYLDWLADAYADPQVWGRQQEALSEFVRECRARSYRVRVVLVPFTLAAASRYDGRAIHGQVSQHFRSLDVSVLDLLPSLEGLKLDDLVVNRFDGHPNEKAHRLFGDAIWRGFYAGGESADLAPVGEDPRANAGSSGTDPPQ